MKVTVLRARFSNPLRKILSQLLAPVVENLGLREQSFFLAKTGGVFGRSPFFDEPFDALAAKIAPRARIGPLPEPIAEFAARAAVNSLDSRSAKRRHLTFVDTLSQDRERALIATGDELATLLHHHASRRFSWPFSTTPLWTKRISACFSTAKTSPQKSSKKLRAARRS